MMEPTVARTYAPKCDLEKVIFALIAVVMTAIGFRNYLLFHMLVELGSALMGLGVGLLTLNAIDSSNGMLRMAGIGNFFIVALGLLHALAYKGMGIFPGDTSNLATQLWISYRSLEAITYCVAVFMTGKLMKVGQVFIGYLVITVLILASIFQWGVFPDCFIGGQGLTPFKVVSEYIIIGIWLLTITMLKKQRSSMDPVSHRYIVYACWANIVSELCFTLYLSVYDIVNMAGHLVMLASFYFMYKAVIQSSLKAPYQRISELEQAHRKALDDLERFFDLSMDALMVVDAKGHIVRTNPALEEMLGYKQGQLRAKRPEELVHPEDWFKVSHRNWLEGAYGELRCIGATGLSKYIGWTAIADPVQELIYVVGRDLTKQKETERELLRLDRLNLAGEMAAGISHEIRNPMTTVRGFLQLLGGKDEYQQDKEFFKLMIDELDRANAIITEFLAVAKNNPFSKEEKDLNAIINAILPLIQADALLEGKQVQTELGDIPCIYADEKEIRQLVLNLVFNGLEAMESKGTLTISTFFDHDHVCLAIADQGPGIPPQLMDRIFNAFFTTKEGGTGLGLAVCQRIVEQHQAKMCVKSGDTGTTFTIRLPIVAAEAVS